jgi:hypothetical protein
MLSLLKNVWQDIKQGENIDLYLTVLLALTLTVLNLFGVAQALAMPVLMAVVALLAISLLVNRRRVEIVIEKLSQSYDDILLEKIPSTFERDMRDAKQVWLIGVVLARTVETHYALIQEKLTKGDSVKVLIVNPHGAANEMVGNRTFRNMSAEESTKRILLSLANLCALKKVAPQHLEIRVIDYPLSLGFLAFDLAAQNGVIYAEHYSYKMGEDLPIMVFRPDNRRWYGFFREQISVLWDNGTEWNCEALP